MDELPIEIIKNVLNYLDWVSINKFLSCNRYYKSLRDHQMIIDVFSNSYFHNIDLSEIDIYSNYSGNILSNYISNLSKYDTIKGKIRTCENNKIYANNITYSLDYIIKTIEMMNFYVEQKNVEVGSINYINLDFFNNFLIENIHNYTIFLNDFPKIHKILNQLLKFNKLILSTDMYGNLYSEILLKNIPYFIYTMLENKFLKSKQLMDLLAIIREFYLSDYCEEIINNGIYDKVYAYLHALTTCTFHKCNNTKNVDDYIDDLRNILLISKESFFGIQITKDCFVSIKYIFYYCKKITVSQKIELLELMKEYSINISIDRTLFKILIDIVNYSSVPGEYYSYIYKLLNNYSNNIFFISKYDELLNICLLYREFNSFKPQFIELLEKIINNQEEIILLIKKLYYCKWLENSEELLVYYYHKTKIYGEKDILENMCSYVKYTKKINYFSIELNKNYKTNKFTLKSPNEFDRSVEYLFD